MDAEQGETLTLAELAKESGLPARTIRFYIARNLLDGPTTAGRGAIYTAKHRQRLEQIRQLQAKGLTLAEIARRLAGERARDALPSPVARLEYALASDVTVSIRSDASPWRLRQIRAALEQLAHTLAQENSHD
jgi:DNA-binding transcriptional MerR regulator